MAWDRATFWLPRRGNNPEEYEDASAPDEAAGRYAVADGASEGCFTGLWATAAGRATSLPRGRGMRPLAGFAFRRPGAMGRRRPRPETGLSRRATGCEQGPSPPSWDVVLENSPLPLGEGPGGEGSHQWQAVAVGDACLFHTRTVLCSAPFPWTAPKHFSNRPQLVGSRMPAAAAVQRQRLWSDGCGQPGDRLWAMTDALAKWCLAEHEAGGDPWRELESLLDLPTRFRGRG